MENVIFNDFESHLDSIREVNNHLDKIPYTF